MMPHVYQRKRNQDAMRRQQQKDEHDRGEEYPGHVEPPEELAFIYPCTFVALWKEVEGEGATFPQSKVRLEAPDLDVTSKEIINNEIVVRYNKAPKLEAENERLRAALEDVLEDAHGLGHVSPETLNGIVDALDGEGDND